MAIRTANEHLCAVLHVMWRIRYRCGIAGEISRVKHFARSRENSENNGAERRIETRVVRFYISGRSDRETNWYSRGRDISRLK